ncbi:hypothetical protein DYB25_009852 [Aphanomyces astaci]|uniref:HTH CENPB-type domain-containing protein n=1 Tax=Aphanomyces astaci TaxID=112090 RepID=A0A397BE88_APHAT|nr:hypothetical protein DYB25_009852 [Aphanomyces astaci]
MRKVRLLKADKDLTPKRRGPKPLFPDSFEQDMVAWISAMQQEGMPATRFVILLKANKLLRRLDPLRTVTGSWYCRFMNRHPELTTRVAQVISNARNSVDEVGVKKIFDSMEEAIRVHGLTAERIFNMDETSFASRLKSKDVVALKGSSKKAAYLKRMFKRSGWGAALSFGVNCFAYLQQQKIVLVASALTSPDAFLP